jgi:hypothetical protein
MDYFTLRDEHRLRVLQNKVLRRRFKSKRESKKCVERAAL